MSDGASGHSELEPSLLTAQALIEWRGGVKGHVPESVILTHQESLFRALMPRLRTRAVEGLFPRLRLLPGSDGSIGVAGGIGVGGPATAMAVEELAAVGVRRIVMVDVAAGIVDSTDHDVVLVTDAIAADGTSRHYLPGAVDIIAGNNTLLGALSQALHESDRQRGAMLTPAGRVASTDAPFRETAALIADFRARGAIAIDMECAAFYASAAAAGVEAAAAVVIGDVLEDDVWRGPDVSIRGELLRVADVVQRVLA
jgi:uridine phosphorylase